MMLKYFYFFFCTSFIPSNIAEILELSCEFIELKDHGLNCEFNNLFIGDTSNINIIESNTSIEAITFRQSELYKVPQDIFLKFPYLKHLDVEQAKLKVIEADNFRFANELKNFIARFNDVTRLDDGIFVSAPKLKIIILQYNQINTVNPRAFKGLNNLEALYLDYNQITTLPSKVLDQVPNLLHLSIADNLLTDIPNNLFKITTKLETLNLGHNLLTYFNESHFNHLPNLESLQLNYNYLKKLEMFGCKSTVINVDKNYLEVIELSKWTNIVSAWGNPVKKLILHEHYSAGRSYNFSFTDVNEIVFFVHENCCSVEDLENFKKIINSFGDLNAKNLNANEWMCIFMKSVSYATERGYVVNDVCTKTNQPVSRISESRVFNDNEYNEETTTYEEIIAENNFEISTQTDLIMEFKRTSTTTEENAYIEEIVPSTTEKSGYWSSFKSNYWNPIKSTASEWKDKASESLSDVKNKTVSWWSG